MRLISFAMTKAQVRARTKTQTRRVGWADVKVGEVLQGVEKCQGLKKGERVTPIERVRVVSVRREPLKAITQADVVAEGFPELTPSQFVEMFCRANRIPALYAFRSVIMAGRKFTPDDLVTVIEFEYVDEPSVTDRFMAGESVEALASSLQQSPAEIENALRRGSR